MCPVIVVYRRVGVMGEDGDVEMLMFGKTRQGGKSDQR